MSASDMVFARRRLPDLGLLRRKQVVGIAMIIQISQPALVAQGKTEDFDILARCPVLENEKKLPRALPELQEASRLIVAVQLMKSLTKRGRQTAALVRGAALRRHKWVLKTSQAQSRPRLTPTL